MKKRKHEVDVPKEAGKVVTYLISDPTVRKATKYLGEKLVVKATRTLYGGRATRRGSGEEIRVTTGRPNYEEREYIKLLKKAKEEFPQRSIALKFI